MIHTDESPIDRYPSLGADSFNESLDRLRDYEGDIEVIYYQRPNTRMKSSRFRANHKLPKPAEGAADEKDVVLTRVCGMTYHLPESGSNVEERIAKFFSDVWSPRAVRAFFHGQLPDLRAGDVSVEVVHQVALRLERLMAEFAGRKVYFKPEGADIYTPATPGIVDVMKSAEIPSEIAFLMDKHKKYVSAFAIDAF